LDEAHGRRGAATLDGNELAAFGAVVRDEEMLELIEQPFGEIVERSSGRTDLLGLGNADQPIVPDRDSALGLIRLDRAEQTNRHEAPDERGLVGDDHDVEWIAVVAMGPGNEPEVVGERGPQREHLVEPE